MRKVDMSTFSDSLDHSNGSPDSSQSGERLNRHKIMIPIRELIIPIIPIRFHNQARIVPTYFLEITGGNSGFSPHFGGYLPRNIIYQYKYLLI